MADQKCSECAAITSGLNTVMVHEPGCPLAVTTVTDKRGERNPDAVLVGDPSLPSVEELEERERLLAEQAAALEESPYSGGGIETVPDEEAQKTCITAFVVIIHTDGTSLAHHNLDILDEYELMMPASPTHMYNAAAQIMMEVQAAEAAQATIIAIENRTVALAAAAANQQRDAIQEKLRQKSK